MSRVMRAWQVCDTWNCAFGAAAKAGSSTLAKMAEENAVRDMTGSWRTTRVHFEHIPRGYDRIGIVRHPIDRFISLYRNIQRRFSSRSNQNFYKQFEGRSTRYLWEGIREDLNHDYHFQPQASIGLADADLLVRLEDLEAWWAIYAPPGAAPIPHENRSDGKTYVVDGDLGQEILEAYDTDLRLWEAAWHKADQRDRLSLLEPLSMPS